MRKLILLFILFWFSLGTVAQVHPEAALRQKGGFRDWAALGQGQSSVPSFIEASRALIRRVIPARAAQFRVEALPDAEGAGTLQDEGAVASRNTANKDVFEIESHKGYIVLRGNNGVAVASALYHYLTNYCHCQVTWNGTNLKLPPKLPTVSGSIRRRTPYTYRYYLNYCTFNYSLSWWGWPRWQREIDWMAMHGINMPLSITGEEYTWYLVYKQMGFTDAELRSFWCGPAYFAWFWMGNLDGWGGPLPLSWMKEHALLEQKILERERSLGMKPVLPAFTGHVPAAFRQRFPKAVLKKTNWHNGFGDTYILDSRDPMFSRIGERFIRTQTRLYGTDHLYSADTFNENEPPSDDSAFLTGLSARIYEGMKQSDTAAVWVMQGWLFYSDHTFWKAPQVRALLASVPDDKMILLDLAAEIEPVWKTTAAFYGKPWIWNMLNNFGGNVNLFGRIDGVASGPAQALADSASGRMEGIGLTMEAIEQNPVIYELMTQHTWQTGPISLDTWLPLYARNRYGMDNAAADSAWAILRRTAYNGLRIRDGAESIVTGRPTFDSSAAWTRTTLNYDAKALLPAWDELIDAVPSCGKSDGFRFDLVDVTRQVLANYATPLQTKWVEAYRRKDKAAFNAYSARFLELIDDMDTLLGTRKDFLLGPWLEDAREWGHTPGEKALYEQNARDLITLWGDAGSPLHEYANRQWNGLLNSFYKVRWQKFFAMLDSSLVSGGPADLEAFDKRIRAWEWGWVRTPSGAASLFPVRSSFTVRPKGDPVKTAEWIYRKYREVIREAYNERSLITGRANHIL